MIATTILVTVIVSFGVIAFTDLAREANRVHGKLKEFHVRATEAKTIDELVGIRQELCAYANKECWHRHFTDHAREVFLFIQGRLAGIKA